MDSWKRILFKRDESVISKKLEKVKSDNIVEPEAYSAVPSIHSISYCKNSVEIRNLYDYLLGVEVGLDSNGRKNRCGHLMEDLVEDYIIKAGYKKDVNYFKKMYTFEIEPKWSIDLSILKGEIKATKG